MCMWLFYLKAPTPRRAQNFNPFNGLKASSTKKLLCGSFLSRKTIFSFSFWFTRDISPLNLPPREHSWAARNGGGQKPGQYLLGHDLLRAGMATNVIFPLFCDKSFMRIKTIGNSSFLSFRSWNLEMQGQRLVLASSLNEETANRENC